MIIKSNKVNNKKRLINKKIDTIYMNTDILFCYNIENKREIANNIKNIIVSKELVEEDTSYITINDTSANNISFEGYDNLSNITIPIEYIKDEDLNLSILNEGKIKCELKKINILKDNRLLLNIDLEDDIKSIEMRKDEPYDLYIHESSNKKIIEHFIDSNDKYFRILHGYFVTDDDLDEFNNLDIRNALDFNNLFFEKLNKNININTFIVDKRVFNHLNSLNFIFQKKEFTIKLIRIIDNNEMKLIPFDKTFKIKNILMSDDDYNKYIYIETFDDEIVIYIDKNNELKLISKKELLKNNDIKDISFRFRKQTRVNGGILNPLSLIIKEYKDGTIKVFDLNNEFIIDEEFKKNIILNIEQLKKINVEELNYIKNNKWLELFNSINFSNRLYKKILLIHNENELIKKQAKNIGLTNDAINYLKSKGILNSILNSNLIQYEVDGFNEIGESYKKILKK